MDQVSRPVQVLLLLTLAFAALWFVALRPKSGPGGSAPAPTPPTPASAAQARPAKSAIPGGLGGALDKARSAAARASAEAASRPDREGAAAGDAATPGRSAPAVGQPARAVGGRPSSRRTGHASLGASPAAVARALARGKAVVLLFYGRGADDRGVRHELSQVPRRGGRVVVLSSSIAVVSRFGEVTRGVRVLEAPTVVVVGPSRRARALPGYTDHTEIDQAVGSALAGR